MCWCSFSVAGLLYAGVAALGFLMFGETTDTQFTLNLPTRLIASNIAGWAVVIRKHTHTLCLASILGLIPQHPFPCCVIKVAAPLTKFGLAMTPVALAMEELLPPDRLTSHTTPILIRTSLVVSTLLVALTVPYFGKKRRKLIFFRLHCISNNSL